METETRTIAVWVGPKGEKQTHSLSYEVQIDDEGGGEYVRIIDGEGGTISVDGETWPALRNAIEGMLAACRVDLAPDDDTPAKTELQKAAGGGATP